MHFIFAFKTHVATKRSALCAFQANIEAPENCSLTYYANLNGDNPEIHLIGSILSKELKIKQLG